MITSSAIVFMIYKGGPYTLIPDSSFFETNKQVMETAFGQEKCIDDGFDYVCSFEVEEYGKIEKALYAATDYNGRVKVSNSKFWTEEDGQVLEIEWDIFGYEYESCSLNEYSYSCIVQLY